MARERKFTRDDLYETTKYMLLENGYEGFTFSKLAEKLNVSRGAIYKYFNNKDELITEFMIYEMNGFLKELGKINGYDSFDDQLNYLFTLIFKNAYIHQMINISKHLLNKKNKKIAENERELARLHLKMYRLLEDFIQQGKSEGKLKSHLPDSLILGYIFQSINIPNHFHIPEEEWYHSLKDMIKYGIFASGSKKT